MARSATSRISKKLVRFSIVAVSAFAMAALVTAVTVPDVGAEGVRPCKGEARQEYGECKADCKEDYQLAKDTCWALDHECVEICRDERHTCREQPVADRNAAIDVCNDTLAQAKAECRSLYADGTSERDQCIDQEQVMAFQCRDNAREITRPLLKACRRALKKCVMTTCPPDVPVDPATAMACKQDAQHTYKACKQDCREEYQLAKDTCLNRDHECVEGCRAIRKDCRLPILEVRDAAIDACNATRASEIATCKELYEPNTSERDACVDQAQVEAFRCRDDARELVRPDLNLCRDAFRTCAQACPPAGE